MPGSRRCPRLASLRELSPRLALHAQLGEHDDEPGMPWPLSIALAGEDPDHRRELCQAPLLAANAEHLDAVGARCVATGQQPAPIVRAPRHRLCLREVARHSRAIADP